MRRRWITAVAAPLALGMVGCATVGRPVGPDYQPPPQATGEAGAKLVSVGGPEFATDAPPDSWWRLYDDPKLDALIAQALAANNDLRIASANLQKSLAALEEVKGLTRPNISLGGSAAYSQSSAAAQGRDQMSPQVTPLDAGLSVSYQLDLFGRVRRTLEAASADVSAVKAAADAARITVVAETARAYADACIAGHQLEVARRSEQLQAESLAMTQRLREAGRVGALDVTRSRALLGQTRATIPPLEAQQRSALYRLAVLTGRPPSEAPTELLQCETPPRVVSAIPVGDGTALLRRRPDIRSAERRLAAATARIGVATADLYPTVSLGAAVGSTALNPASLLTGSALRFSVGPLIQYTLPTNGVARARIVQAEASTAALLADFDRTVLNGLRETETALTAYARELDRNAELRRARDESAEVVHIAERLRKAGAVGSLDVLDAQRSLASAEATLAASDGLLSSQQIAIFLALGGGWDS